MSELEVWKVFAAAGWTLAAAGFLGVLGVLAIHARHLRTSQRQVDLLLLLGKSANPGEAIQAVERIHRLDLTAPPARARGADQQVARKGRGWRHFFRHHRPQGG